MCLYHLNEGLLPNNAPPHIYIYIYIHIYEWENEGNRENWIASLIKLFRNLFKVGRNGCFGNIIFYWTKNTATYIYMYVLLWYYPYFRYTMDSSHKDITFNCNPLREKVARATLVTLYYLFVVIYDFFSSLYICVCLINLCPFLRT